MTSPVRIGLLGASRIARKAVIAAARGDERFVVAAVAARDQARARAYADEYGMAAASDYAELVGRDDVEVVYNALPPAGHARWSIAALEAGKAVLCEKPFALNAPEALAMTAAAERTGGVLLEAFHYRFHAVMRRAEALVSGGVLGRLTGGEAVLRLAIPRQGGELRWSAAQGGGGLLDLGCYCLHALRTLMRSEPHVAGARARFEQGVDAELAADLVFPGGVRARIACSMIEPRYAARLRLNGERGALQIDNFLAPQRGCRFITTIDGVTARQPTDGEPTYEAQLDHLYAVIRQGARPLTGGADAVANMAAIDSVMAAARAG
jgi:predicted dehydrogenase